MSEEGVLSNTILNNSEILAATTSSLKDSLKQHEVSYITDNKLGIDYAQQDQVKPEIEIDGKTIIIIIQFLRLRSHDYYAILNKNISDNLHVFLINLLKKTKLNKMNSPN